MNYGMYGIGDDGEFIYAGGPLILMPDESEGDSRVKTWHDMDSSNMMCRKCKKSRSTIDANPYDECLYDVDFSAITMGVVGGR